MADPLDELYAGPLEAFVSRRNELAAARRKTGDKEGAAEVKAAVKPTVSAWIVNQVAHHHAAVVRAWLAATADVVAAQLDAGGGADDRRRYERALAKQRTAEERLNEAVRDVVSDPSGDLSRRVLENFRRGALDAETRQLLRAGRLTRDVESQDFGALLQQMGARPAAAGQRKDTEAARRKTEDDARKAAEAERRQNEAAALREMSRAEKEVARLRLELAAAEKELARARAEVGRQ